MMDSKDGSFVVVSGDIGIGKTSFVNVQQHILASGLAGWGPRLLPCLRITPLMLEDDPTSLARRIVDATVQNIEAYCTLKKMRLPAECEVVRNWLSHRPTPSSYQITLGTAGFGRSWALPPVGDATLETWRNILEALAREVRTFPDIDGFIICLDNAETLPHSQLARLLMSYRDIMFVIKGIWWIMIGQSGLYKEIDAIDRRVSQRISGSGVELSHFKSPEFHDLIERRIRVYRNRDDAVSPLSMDIHDLLFKAAFGEIRFVFDTANTLIQQIVTKVRQDSIKKMRNRASPAILEQVLTQALKHVLIDNRIPDELAIKVLKGMTEEATASVAKVPDTMGKLKSIGSRTVTKEDYDRYGFASAQEFSSCFLEPLHSQGLLGRQLGAGEATYQLKGFAWLSREFGIMG